MFKKSYRHNIALVGASEFFGFFGITSFWNISLSFQNFSTCFSLSTKFISDETFSYTIVLLLSNHLLNRNDVSLLYWCCNKCRYICKKAPAVIRQGLNQLNLYQLRHTIICVPCNGRITVLTYFS